MTDQKIMQMALEALEWEYGGEPLGSLTLGAITLLRERLAQPAAEVEEGCTPADARKLREANHALAQENHELRERLAQADPAPCNHEWFRTGAMNLNESRCLRCGGWRIKGKPQPDPEPVAFMYTENGETYFGHPDGYRPASATPLYTAPPRREWQGLTEPELHEINPTWPNPGDPWEYENVLAFASAIEAALKEKNNG